MGCWQGTCGVSHLPIEHGTKARLFVLGVGCTTDDGRQGFVYPTGLWEPIALPLIGNYDSDHAEGQLTGAKFIGGEVTEEVVKDRGFPAMTKETLRKLDRGELTAWQIGRGEYGHHPVGQMLIRQDVWRELLKLTHGRPWGSYASIQGEVRFWVESLMKEGPVGMKERLCSFKAPRWPGADRRGFLHSIEQHYEGDPFLALYLNALALRMSLKAMNADEAIAVLDEVAALYHVSRVMADLRTAWAPQPGAGSQTLAWGTHASFHSAMGALAAKNNRRF